MRSFPRPGKGLFRMPTLKKFSLTNVHSRHIWRQLTERVTHRPDGFLVPFQSSGAAGEKVPGTKKKMASLERLRSFYRLHSEQTYGRSQASMQGCLARRRRSGPYINRRPWDSRTVEFRTRSFSPLGPARRSPARASAVAPDPAGLPREADRQSSSPRCMRRRTPGWQPRASGSARAAAARR
jgi:hypothetical protein